MVLQNSDGQNILEHAGESTGQNALSVLQFA